MTDTIRIDHMTKDYGLGRGAFDITLSVHAGECYGFLGPNGAGKTTTIRQLMGFTRPNSGRAEILGKDCWREAAVLKNHIGYICSRKRLNSLINLFGSLGITTKTDIREVGLHKTGLHICNADRRIEQIHA